MRKFTVLGAHCQSQQCLHSLRRNQPALSLAIKTALRLLHMQRQTP